MSDVHLMELYPLCFRTQPVPSADLGTMGELVWLPLAKLRIDPRYQRPITDAGRRTIEAIVEGFAWAKFSPLVVGERAGGLFAIIDGQHRATGAMTHGGIAKVPCWIIRGGPEVEASAFAIINGQVTGITATQIHVARVMGSEPGALRLNRVCEAAMVRVLRTPPAPGKWKPGDTVAVTVLQSCLKRYGAETLTTALQCITQTGDGNPGFVRASVIRGFCDALHKTKWCNSGEALFKAIETAGVPRLFGAALSFRAAHAGTEWTAMAKVVRTLLGTELPGGSAPPLQLAAKA